MSFSDKPDRVCMFPGYLPPNQKHIVLFGNPRHSVESWNILGIGPDNQRFFDSDAEMVEALEALGLAKHRNGVFTEIR